MIDWDRVSELRDEVGAEDFLEVVEMFLDEVNEEIDTITDEMTAQELEAKLHFLKGSALNLGLKTFAEMCRVGEDMARQGELHGIDRTAIVTCYHASIEAFENALPSNAAA